MIVREEKITWVVKRGNLYKQTEVTKRPTIGRVAPKWTSEFVRKATEQDMVGNV